MHLILPILSLPLSDLKKHMKAAETSIPLPVVEKLFLAADDDLDGILEYQEFAKVVPRPGR
jgi:Ca2+-binding EF-hand superfamily protein